jgi:hypothetical protein
VKSVGTGERKDKHMIHRIRNIGMNFMVRMVIIDSRARPLITDEHVDRLIIVDDLQGGHTTPRHHPVDDKACMPKSSTNPKVKLQF